MVSVKEARERLLNSCRPLPRRRMPVVNSLGYVLAQDVRSPVDSPAFNQSAVDGYAVYTDKPLTDEPMQFTITDELKAGDRPILFMKNNTAVRLFTGSAVPLNAMGVVMQEKVTVVDKTLHVPSEYMKAGANIRYRGTQIKKGETALGKKQILNPAAIGFLLSLGITDVIVYPKPVVTVLATGNELVEAGKKLQPGQIFESNTGMLQAALHQTGFHAVSIKTATDTKATIKSHLRSMLLKSEVMIVSGGISVGKYDLVKETLEALGVKELFYKVAQKPGKPLYAGKKGRCMVFAVPGNPAAALVCYYEYILPVLRRMSGLESITLKKEWLPLASAFTIKGDRDVFLKAMVHDGLVQIHDGQESNILKTFATSNALVYLPSGAHKLKSGDRVETHLLP